MRAGKLDRRINIQVNTPGKSAGGDNVDAWSLLATTWARKVDLSGRELEAAATINHEISIKFLIRYREDVVAGMRIELKGMYFRIISALDKSGDRDELQIYCTTGSRDVVDVE